MSAIEILRQRELFYHDSIMRNQMYLLGALGWCFAMVISASAQVVQPQLDTSSCRQFSQDFYDWYVPLTQKKLHVAVWNVALQRKPDVFSSDLLWALKNDSEAQSRAKGELVGLDFDPFVGGQDPADHYEVRKAALERTKCSVEVWRNSPNDRAEKSDKPDASAELVQQNGHWKFTNFRYPQLNADLRNVLAALAKDRREP